MIRRNKKKNPRSLTGDIVKEIGRRGIPAEAKPITIMSAMGSVRRTAIIVPGRGVAVMDVDFSIFVASSNKPLPQALVFEYENTESAAENILRNLPMP